MGECVYQDTYDDQHFGAACAAAATVPLGCPISYVIVHGAVGAGPSTTRATRGGTLVELSGQTVVVGTDTQVVTTTDFFSCACASHTGPMQFNHVEVTLANAQVGDVITWSPSAADSQVTIVAAAPCRAIAWPTAFREEAACDLCPQPTDFPTDGGTATAPHHAGGCATTGGRAGAPGLLLVVAAMLIRRPRRSRRTRTARR